MMVLGDVELGSPPKVLVLGVLLGCLLRGVSLWSLGRWAHGGGSQALADPCGIGVWGNPSELPGDLSGSPFPQHPLARVVAKPLTLNPPQVSGSLRQKAMPGTAPSELQELQSRTECAERRLLACENLVGELGSGLAALGTVLQSYGQLQQRLLNLENLLKNRNFWILRLPPSSRGEIPKVAAAASQ